MSTRVRRKWAAEAAQRTAQPAQASLPAVLALRRAAPLLVLGRPGPMDDERVNDGLEVFARAEVAGRPLGGRWLLVEPSGEPAPARSRRLGPGRPERDDHVGRASRVPDGENPALAGLSWWNSGIPFTSRASSSPRRHRRLLRRMQRQPPLQRPRGRARLRSTVFCARAASPTPFRAIETEPLVSITRIASG